VLSTSRCRAPGGSFARTGPEKREKTTIPTSFKARPEPLNLNFCISRYPDKPDLEANSFQLISSRPRSLASTHRSLVDGQVIPGDCEIEAEVATIGSLAAKVSAALRADLDDDELRSASDASTAASERLRAFSVGRISTLLNNEAPLPFSGHQKSSSIIFPPSLSPEPCTRVQKLPTGKYFIGLRRPVTCRKTNSTRIRIVWHGEKVNGANFPDVIPQECSPGVARPLILRITITGAFLGLNCENQPHALGT
jgi:hypothetical protein